MATSKKDYIAIAAIIAEERRSADTWISGLPALPVSRSDCDNSLIASTRKTCAGRLAMQMAEYFAQSNPQFDRVRFLQACGVQS